MNLTIFAITNSDRVLAAGAAGVLIFWILPSVLVAIRAEGDGFSLGAFLLVALFLSWPVALALTLIFGERSPLIRALRRRSDVA